MGVVESQGGSIFYLNQLSWLLLLARWISDTHPACPFVEQMEGTTFGSRSIVLAAAMPLPEGKRNRLQEMNRGKGMGRLGEQDLGEKIKIADHKFLLAQVTLIRADLIKGCWCSSCSRPHISIFSVPSSESISCQLGLIRVVHTTAWNVWT